MTNVLLIILLIMALVTMVSSVITMVVVTSESKKKELVFKTLKIISIVLLVFIIVGASIGASYIKKSDDNIEETTVTLENAGFNEVSIDEYLSLIKKPEKNVILVARPTCSYCEKFTPVLKKAKDELNIEVNYINTDNFSEEDWEKFNSSLEFLSTEEWGTPLLLITENGKLIAEHQGYTELSDTKKFFEDNKIGTNNE